ncbi:MAG TPA: NfeD family protein, partial [Candidatus Brocadiia bacterium]|nr:NfeD family protein [Candidatus Brocadiia bacterium]
MGASILLIALGVVLVLADLFIPSFGLLVVSGLGVTVWGVSLLFARSALAGWLGVAGAAAGLAGGGWAAWRLARRSSLFLKAVVPPPPGMAGGEPPRLGAAAQAVTPLRPVGKVTADGRLFDAICETTLVETGAQVRVVAVRGGQLVV